MVLDASAVVAIFKQETKAPKVEEALRDSSPLLMASASLTEVILAGLKIGDAFVYALAKARNLPVLTLDARSPKPTPTSSP